MARTACLTERANARQSRCSFSVFQLAPDAIYLIVYNQSHRLEDDAMNAPAPKFMIESAWHGRIFTSGWTPANGGGLEVLEPATGSVLTRVGNADVGDVMRAATQARCMQPAWAATPYEQRAAILRKAAALLEENQEEIVDWIMRETGGIRPKAGFEVHMVVNILHRAAAMVTEPQGLMLPTDPGRISMARRVPRGVVGVISPFNFPLILSARAVAPALAVGNAVVLKPDPRTVLSGGFVLARLFEAAGLPGGVLHVLPGGPPLAKPCARIRTSQ
jgi:benzaldehyde dehydrogenase (NAD)